MILENCFEKTSYYLVVQNVRLTLVKYLHGILPN